MIIKELPKERPNDFTKVLTDVEAIIRLVKEKGDKAIVELEEKFDKVKLNSIIEDKLFELILVSQLD